MLPGRGETAASQAEGVLAAARPPAPVSVATCFRPALTRLQQQPRESHGAPRHRRLQRPLRQSDPLAGGGNQALTSKYLSTGEQNILLATVNIPSFKEVPGGYLVGAELRITF